MKRRKARLALVNIGEPAIDFLAEFAAHPDWKIRWEAIRALAQMRNPDTSAILINALDDEYEGIRWLAAEGIIMLGREGLIALLQALTSYKLTILLREGAYHVLKQMAIRYKLPNMEELIHGLVNADSFFNVQAQAELMLNILHNNTQH
jgi:HEAT repeat protein